MWVLNLSDGTRSIQEIASRSQLAEAEIVRAVSALSQIGLLDPAPNHSLSILQEIEK